VNSFFTGIRETIAPPPGARHGPLPPLLLGLTVVTGLVDAFSYLVLGHVFVANMTGNVVFLAFALAGARGFSIGSSAVALVSFGLGALAGGEVGARLGQNRGRQLSAAVFGQAVLVAVAVLVAALSRQPVPGGFRYPLIVALAVAMGTQNATVRQLAVPDLQTTNVLTTTITGIAADSAMAAGRGWRDGRRFLSVVALFIGALLGAVFVLHVAMVLPLIVALVALTVVAVTTRVLARAAPPWARP
jgi:uncharacterized membrane protein YoaK (UPF0700 family)